MVKSTLGYELTNYHLITLFMQIPESLKITGCNAEKIRNGTGPFIKFREWVNGKLRVNCKTALFETGSKGKPRQEHSFDPVLEVSASDVGKAVAPTGCPFTGCIFHQKPACSTSKIRTQ